MQNDESRLGFYVSARLCSFATTIETLREFSSLEHDRIATMRYRENSIRAHIMCNTKFYVHEMKL